MFNDLLFNFVEIFLRILVAWGYAFFVLKTSLFFFEIDAVTEIKKGNTAIALLMAAIMTMGAIIIALFDF